MQPGIPALLLLAICALLGLWLGVMATGNQINDPGRRGVMVHAIATGTVALVFWLWAVKKVLLQGDADYGALSFAAVLVSSAHGYRCAVCLAPDFLTRQRWLLLGSTTLVVSNYALVLGMDLPATFRVYLAVGAFAWACAGGWGWYQLAKLRSSHLPF